MKVISLIFNCLFVGNLQAISFGFKTCTTYESETNEAVTLTIYEGSKMFQCEIPSANEPRKVYKCSDKPKPYDIIAYECRSDDTDKYGMLISVPPNDNTPTDDVCIDALIVNGPTEYDTQNAYIGDGFGFSFKHSRYYDFNGNKPSDSNSGPFTNTVVYEGIPTCFEECSILPPPPPPLELACIASGEGPGQVDQNACDKYCKDKGCFLVEMFCNYGALTGDGEFVPNPDPCVPTCGDTEPEEGPMIRMVAAHNGLPVNVIDNDNNNMNNEELIKEFYEMKNKMDMNNIMIMVYFTIIAFGIISSVLCVYHKMINDKSNQKVTYASVEEEENVKINQ